MFSSWFGTCGPRQRLYELIAIWEEIPECLCLRSYSTIQYCVCITPLGAAGLGRQLKWNPTWFTWETAGYCFPKCFQVLSKPNISQKKLPLIFVWTRCSHEILSVEKPVCVCDMHPFFKKNHISYVLQSILNILHFSACLRMPPDLSFSHPFPANFIYPHGGHSWHFERW